jgi:hypothetical protein
MAEVGDERFGEKKLYQAPDAPTKHFSPIKVEEGIPRDRFDNRIFTSPTKSYNDREGDEVKAGLLVSKQGEDLLKANTGILQRIDHGLTHFAANPTDEEAFALSDDLHMKKIGSGSQSDVYLLTSGQEKYVVKKNTSGDDLSQPYINEMLQSQSIAADLDKQLKSANMEMPTFLFASGQMSCVQYEEGKEPTKDRLEARFSSIIPDLKSYIENQNHTGNNLWNDIVLDTDSFVGFRPNGLKTNNFIERPDGTIVYIDPFLHR